MNQPQPTDDMSLVTTNDSRQDEQPIDQLLQWQPLVLQATRYRKTTTIRRISRTIEIYIKYHRTHMNKGHHTEKQARKHKVKNTINNFKGGKLPRSHHHPPHHQTAKKDFFLFLPSPYPVLFLFPFLRLVLVRLRPTQNLLMI